MDVTPIGRGSGTQGLTLVELLITIALIGILLSWGAPDFINLYRNNALTSQANTLLAHLMHARSEAIKSNLPAVICRSADGDNCLSSPGARADWSMGWIIFLNADEDKTRDSEEPMIRVEDKLDSSLSLQFNRWWRLTFQPTGRTSNGTFSLCGSNGKGRLITVYMSGRFRLSNPDKEGTSNPCSS